MSTLDLLRVGRKSKKNFINKSHDVNTTSDFGFCQPTLCDLVIPGSNVSLTTKQFVRLAPLPTPTFGRVKIHTDTSFIPVKDVFPAFDNLMGQYSVNNPNVQGGYVPQGHNYMQKGDFLASLIALSFYYAKQGEYDKVPFRFDVYTNAGLKADELDDDYHQKREMPWRSVMNDPELNSMTAEPLSDYLNTGYGILKNLFGESGSFYSYLGSLLSLDGYSPTFLSPLDGSFDSEHDFSFPDIGLFLTYLTERNDVLQNARVSDWNPIPPNSPLYDGYLDRFITHNGSYITGDLMEHLYEKYPNVISEPISPDNADYYFTIGLDILGETYPVFVESEQHTARFQTWNNAIVCLKLTPFGRRLMKVFTGLYNTDCLSKYIPNFTSNLSSNPWSASEHDVISLTPLFAYYKHWFDIYNPAREKTWFDTNCFKLIHAFYDYPMPLHSWFYSLQDSDFFTDSIYSFERTAGALKPLRKAWFDFLIELGECVYVLPIDNITVATPEPVGNVQTDVNNVQFPIFTSSDPSEEFEPTITSVTAGVDSDHDAPYGSENGNAVSRGGGLGVHMLMRLYNWSNKNSVLRKNLKAYLKKYNIQLPSDSILDRSSYYAQIDDVFSTAETSDGYLGEFAGRGLGSGVCKASLQDTKDYGFLIQTLCISPHSGYVQANQLFPITRMEHYQDMFDSLGMEPMSMRQVSARDFNLSEVGQSRLFGFRPRFFNLKVKNNLANGYFANRGSMSQYLPYSLDRIFAVKDLNLHTNYLRFQEGYYPLANEDIRKVGLVEQLGQYDRIFVDNTGMTDNFIFNILQEYKVWAPVKPVSDSFDTFDKETDDDTFNVEHS